MLPDLFWPVVLLVVLVIVVVLMLRSGTALLQRRCPHGVPEIDCGRCGSDEVW